MPVPTTESAIRPVDYRRRIRWYSLDAMIELKVKNQAEVMRRTSLDKGFISNLVDPEGEPPLGLENFAKLTSGLRFSADAALHVPHPAESNERTRAKLDAFARSLRRPPT